MRLRMVLSIRFLVIVICSSAILFSSGCHDSDKSLLIEEESLGNKYAGHFQIAEFNGYKRLSIIDPWQESSGIVYHYYLTKDPNLVPDSVDRQFIIQIPLKRVVCMSTTQIAFIDQLDKLNTICAVSGKSYIFNKKILYNPDIQDIGYDAGINYELIIDLNPDLVLLYGVGSEVTGVSKKINDLGIKTMIIAEHLESTPLAKFEWIKVFGELYYAREEADSNFSITENNYNKLLEMMDTVPITEKVLNGLPYKEIWYVSSAKTNLAQLIEDAGGEYIWAKQSGDVSALDIEAVVLKAGHADVWINTGNVCSKEEIELIDPRLVRIKAFQDNRIYNNNLRLNEFGGNDYYESGVVRPDLVLMDLIKIMHSDKMGDHEFCYYQKLK